MNSPMEAPIREVDVRWRGATVRRVFKARLEKGTNRVVIGPVTERHHSVKAVVSGSQARVLLAVTEIGHAAKGLPKDPGVNEDSPPDSEARSFREAHERTLEALLHSLSQAEFDSAYWESQFDELDQWFTYIFDRSEPTGEHTTAGANLPVSANASIRLTLDADTAGEYEIAVSYETDEACWRPAYQAVLSDSGRMEFLRRIFVWQRSGEDWSEVKLTFCADDSEFCHGPPPLVPDELVVCERRSRRIVVHTPSPETTSDWEDGLEGASVSISLPRLSSIACDGRPVALFLDARVLKPRWFVRWLGYLPDPPLEISRQTHDERFPLLPGPVDLVKNGVVVGRCHLKQIWPGMDFELTWGTAGEFATERTHQMVSRENAVLASKRTQSWEIRGALRNLGEADSTVEVVERLPVSRCDEVRIAAKDFAVDSHGFHRLRVEVPAGERAEYTLRWRLDFNNSVEGLEQLPTVIV